MAKCLWDNFIAHYGFPERLLSDQGPDFESHTIKELCELAGIKKVHTTPYHPRGNPVERFNRTLLQMLGTLSQPEKLHWKDYVKPLVHAYNCTKNETTGFSPDELMFGRQPRLPIDLAFGLPTDPNKLSHSQYVSNLKCRLEQSYKIASSTAQKNADRNKTRFDKHVVESNLEVGDRILVRNVKMRGKHKLADKWEGDVYVVLKKAGDMPVYTVKPEGKNGPARTLHRDLLLPCGFLPAAMTSEPVTQLPVRRPRTRQCPASETEEEEEDSDSEIVPTLTFFPFHLPEPDDNVTHLLQNPPCEIIQSNGPNVSSAPVLPGSPARKFPAVTREELSMQNLLETVNLPEKVNEQIPGTDKTECDSAEHVCPVERGNLPVDVNDVQGEQHTVPDVDESESNGEIGETESGEPQEKGTDESNEMEMENEERTEIQTRTDTPVRRSDRTRQPPKRLDYVEFWKPLITAVKSLFHGLTIALADALNEEENSSYPHVMAT